MSRVCCLLALAGLVLGCTSAAPELPRRYVKAIAAAPPDEGVAP